MDVLHLLLGGLSGVLVGFTLGLVGGGGSILAVPLMVYVVGVDNPHVAIGTSALAVAANAVMNLGHHARRGNVRWTCAAVFAAAGVIGAYGGSTLGKAIDGQKLLLLFALLMLVVGVLMLRGRGEGGDADARLDRRTAPRLIAATRMPMLLAIGSSLVAVNAFGLTTALNYARSGLIDWTLAGVFVGGGLLGGLFGASLATRLSRSRGALNRVFAGLIFAVALYMLVRSARVLLGG